MLKQPIYFIFLKTEIGWNTEYNFIVNGVNAALHLIETHPEHDEMSVTESVENF